MKEEKKNNLISNLISALNGGPEDMADAAAILQEIKATNDPLLIDRAEKICSVI